MTDAATRLTHNRLLASLPWDEAAALFPCLEYVTLHRGTVIYDQGEAVGRAYFPAGGVVSIVSDSEAGKGVEVCVVGSEGVAGVGAVLSGVAENTRAVVQMESTGWLLAADALRGQFARGGQLQRALLGYTHLFLTQLAQAVVCQCHHLAEGRLARWLLECRDRARADELRLTHDYIAEMIGIRRPGVTNALRRFRDAGALDASRGQVVILDARLMEAVACECYAATKAAQAQALADIGAADVAAEAEASAELARLFRAEMLAYARERRAAARERAGKLRRQKAVLEERLARIEWLLDSGRRRTTRNW